MKKKLLAALLMSTALLATACGDDDEEEENSADVEACEHLQEGPSTAVTATLTGTPPSVSNDHRRYDVTLVSGAGGNTGSVSFAAAEEADYVIFTSVNVPLNISSSGGTVEIEESTTSSDQCTEIKGRHVVFMSVGTHTITFGPTPASTVSVVIEESAHEDHEH